MGSPYNVDYTVPVGTEKFYYDGRCYTDGDVVSMKREDFLACQKTQIPADEDLSKCFPEYCEGSSGGYPTRRYNVMVDVPALSAANIAVASIEGCKPAKTVCFHTCGNCMYVEYDSPALVNATDANVVNGGGADPDPSCRLLGDTEVIHFFNPNDFDVKVTLSYYC